MGRESLDVKSGGVVLFKRVLLPGTTFQRWLIMLPQALGGLHHGTMLKTGGCGLKGMQVVVSRDVYGDTTLHWYSIEVWNAGLCSRTGPVYGCCAWVLIQLKDHYFF